MTRGYTTVVLPGPDRFDVGAELPGSLRHPCAGACSGNGSREPGGHVDLVDRPSGHRDALAPAGPHVKGAQGDGEPCTDALHVRLLAGPALKRSRETLRRRQGRQRTLLGPREEPCRDAVDVGGHTDLLDVDADLDRLTRGIERHACAAGGAETEVGVREHGLPAVAGDDPYLARGTGQLACEQVTEPSPGGQEARSVQRPKKAIRTLPLLRREAGRQASQRAGGDVERSPPQREAGPGL